MVGLCVCLLDECTIELVGLVLLSLALSLSLCLNVIFCFRGRAIFCRGMVIKSITLAYCFAFFLNVAPTGSKLHLFQLLQGQQGIL